jgi:2-polyprenyl-3-methyl-5-hydroxy-6-metoxy-1,4-benzoquinol methylase
MPERGSERLTARVASVRRVEGRQSENVRVAYNEVSSLYRGDDDSPAHHVAWATQLHQRLDASSSVLDLGCGCGVPIARDLVRYGHNVTGVDISDVQVQRAKHLVPTAQFICADATEVSFQSATFDAVVCLYALIHMPLDAQPELISKCAEWLRPGGWLLATTGQSAWTGSEANWLGSTATMWWSQSDAVTYRCWLAEADFEILDEEYVPEGDGGHALFWARRSPIA